MSFRRRLAAYGAAPFPLTDDQLRTLQGLHGAKGAGVKVLKAWKAGQPASIEDLKNVLHGLDYLKSIYGRFGYDQKHLNDANYLYKNVENLIAQGSKKKKVRKPTPLQEATASILEDAKYYKPLAQKIITRLGLTKDQAMGFASDLLEDINYPVRELEETVPTEQSGYTSDDIMKAAQATEYSNAAWGLIYAMMVILKIRGAKTVLRKWARWSVENL